MHHFILALYFLSTKTCKIQVQLKVILWKFKCKGLKFLNTLIGYSGMLSFSLYTCRFELMLKRFCQYYLMVVSFCFTWYLFEDFIQAFMISTDF